MQAIGDMLKDRQVPQEPEESRLLKSYVRNRYKAEVRVIMSEHRIVLEVPNAALAGTLKLEQQTIVQLCKITKKLLIRIV